MNEISNYGILPQNVQLAQNKNTREARDCDACFSTQQNYQAGDAFSSSQAGKTLPRGKAIKVSQGLDINPLNLLLLPFGIVGWGTKTKLDLINLDVNNLSKKEKEQIEKQEILLSVPLGYKIENDKMKKM